MKRFLGIVLKLLFLCVIGILIGFIIFFLDYENIEKNGEYKYFYEYKTYSGKNRHLPESIRSYKDNKLEGKYVSFHYTGEYESVKPKVFYRTPKWYKPVVKSLGTFKQNKKEGTWNYYFENNQLHKHGSYKNGLKEGPWNYYFENGQLHKHVSYKNGLKERHWITYYENGIPKSKGEYVNDSKEGLWFLYNESGNLVTEGDYKDGIKEGLWETYYTLKNEKGEKIYNILDSNFESYKEIEKLFDDQFLESSEFYINGVPQETKEELLNFRNGLYYKVNSYIPYSGNIIFKTKMNKISDKEVGDFKDGKPHGKYKSQTYKNGVLHGLSDYYDTRTNLHMRGNYFHGEKDGFWIFYTKKNKYKPYEKGPYEWSNSEGSYKNGLKVGQWKSYYNDGQLCESGSYNNGIKEGLWTSYYKKGQVSKSGRFINGKKDGLWNFYDEDGRRLDQSGFYKENKLVY
jgi:antitoxin component YwqK of YwqJK toxin-antitoxin module